jgi:potassium-transporting ATPase KdpC subunit
MLAKLKHDVGASVATIVVVTALFGLGLPALFTGFSLLAFHHQADASLITKNGKVVGSELAAQGFAKPQYFVERPSATAPAYNAAGTTFSNLGPTSAALKKQVDAAIAAVMKLEGPYNPGLTVHDIPVDAVTTSGSGIDPDISPAYAELQSHRVAAVRHLPLSEVQKLISENTDGRSLDFFGEPGVNVLKLNLALDKAQGR